MAARVDDHAHKTRPISLRLTPAERSRLEAAAGSQNLSSYIRRKLFDDVETRRYVRTPRADERSIAALLARLGQSEVFNNLTELAEAARIGALPVTPETEDAIQSACRSIEAIRGDLIAALGLQERGRP